MAIVADLLARLGLDVSGFKKGVQDAGAAAGKLGDAVKESGKPVEGLKNAFAGLAQEGAALAGRLGPVILSLGAVGAAIGAVSLVTVKAVQEFTKFTTQVRDLAFLSGGSARDVSVLVAGLEDLGVSGETITVAMNRMSAAIASGDPALARLGITGRTTSGQFKTGLAVFYETVEALGKMTSETERNDLSRQIFGRGWTEMVLVLQRGSAAIRQLGEESGKFVGPEHFEALREYAKTVRDLQNVWEKTALSIASVVVPAFTDLGKAIQGAWSFVDSLLDALERLAARFPGLPALPGLAQPGTGTALRLSDRAERMVDWGKRGPELPFEQQKRLTIESTLAQLRAGAQAAGAFSIEDILSAQIAAVNAKRLAAQNELSIALKAGTYKDEKEIADLRTAINAQADAEIGRARRDALVRQRDFDAEIHLQIFRERENMGEKELVRVAKEQTDIEAITLEGTARTEINRREMIEESEALIKHIREVAEAAGFGGDEFREPAITPQDVFAAQLKNRLERRTEAQQAAAVGLGGAQFLPGVQLQERLKQLGIEASLVGREHFDELTERINATRQAMKEMIADGIEPTETKLQELQISLAELFKIEELRATFRSVFASVSDAVSTSFKGIIQGTQNMEEAFRRMGQSIALSLVDSIVKKGLNQVGDALYNFLFKSGGGIIGTILGGIGGWLAPTPAFAAPANPVPLGFFQEGGVVPGPRGMPMLSVVHGGEEILTPEQRVGGGAIVQQVFNISPGVPEAVRREIWAMMPIIEQRTVGAVLSARNRGGEVASAVGARRR